MPTMTKLSLLAATALATLAVASSASAASYFHAGTATGNVLPNGTVVQGSKAAGGFSLIVTGFGTISCPAQTITYTAGASGGATIGVSLTTWASTGCTDTLPVINVTACNGSGLPLAGTATGTGAAGGTIAFTNLIVKCTLNGLATFCYYRVPTATGTYTNTNATLVYNAVAATHYTLPADDQGALCGTNAALSAAVDDQSTLGAMTPTVLLNTTP
jgi:hypothetical protein